MTSAPAGLRMTGLGEWPRPRRSIRSMAAGSPKAKNLVAVLAHEPQTAGAHEPQRGSSKERQPGRVLWQQQPHHNREQEESDASHYGTKGIESRSISPSLLAM